MSPTRAGIFALLTVVPLVLLAACADSDSDPLAPTEAVVSTPKKITYYVAADIVPWNYAPAGTNEVAGREFIDEEKVFVESGKHRIGSTYYKALYREYTDGTFSTLKPRAAEWAHLGMLGPVLRAAVDDTIEVVFRNNADRPFSMHPHGVLYDKNSEGAPTNDGSGMTADDAVPAGGTHVYTWIVPTRAGPGPNDGNSIIWLYHSHTDEVMDTNAGLVGPIIITARGQGDEQRKPFGVDREFVLLLTVTDENSSWYLERNISAFAEQPAGVKPDDEDFEESNLMHNINGYVYGNMPLDDMTMRTGEVVRWYAVAIGTEVDLHAAHWHGNTLLWSGLRTDVIELLPASMKTLDMDADNPGIWLLHCHVNDHITAGMSTRFRVE
jgi:hephaestin